MSNEPNREEEEATRRATAGLVNEFEQLLGDIGRGGDFPMARARAPGPATAPASNEPALPIRPRGIALNQPSPTPAFNLPLVPRLPVRARGQTPPTASSRHVSPLPRSPLGIVKIVAADPEPEPGPEADGSPGEAASTDRQEGREQINPQIRRPGMFSLFPTRSERTNTATMMASSTTSPSQGNNLSSPSPGSQPTETLALPGLPSLEERLLSAASVASAAPSSGSASAGEDSMPHPASHLELNNPFGYPAPPRFRHNWSNPNRRAARGAVLSGVLSGVVVGSRPRPSVSFGVPDPASPPAPTWPPPPVPPSRPAPATPSPPPIPARNPARSGPASPAPSSSAGDDKMHAAEKEDS